MTTLRLSYKTLSPEAYKGLLATSNALQESTLGRTLIELVNLRVSQINGCAYCLEMHAKILRDAGMPNEKIDSVAGWVVSSHFDARERAALQWAESLVYIETTHADDKDYEPLKAYFTDKEISDLTFAVALMSAFNRIGVGMRL